MSDAPVKNYFVSGNLNRQSFLTSKICDQSTNISLGLWHICITSICLDCKEPNGIFCTISCNLVTDKRLNFDSKIETYHSPIATVFLKGRKIVYLEKTWYTINNQCSEIKLFFTNIHTGEVISTDCEIYVNVLFQRVK
jgi:hypothetical protein